MNFPKILIMQMVVVVSILFGASNTESNPFKTYLLEIEESEKEFLSMLQVEKTRQIEIRRLKKIKREEKERVKRERQLRLAEEAIAKERMEREKERIKREEKRIEREKEYSRIRKERIRKEKEEEARRELERKHVLAKVDVSKQRMMVYQGGELIHTWKVSTGRRGYHTPRGDYRPTYIQRMHYSKKYHNSPMPYSVFFYGGYAIHGTSSVWALGRRASHGCVRIHTYNAKKFYHLVKHSGKNNTKIKIVN